MAVAPGSEDNLVANGSSLYSENSSGMSDQNFEADALLNALSQEQSSQGVASRSIKAADQQSNKALLQFLPPNLSKVDTQPVPKTYPTAQHHQARVFTGEKSSQALPLQYGTLAIPSDWTFSAG